MYGIFTLGVDDKVTLPGFEIIQFNYYSLPPLSGLSNFAPVDIVFDDHVYPSVEHAYQAAKTLDRDQQARIRRAPNGFLAKRLGPTVELRANWNDMRYSFMRKFLEQKFSEADYRDILIETGDSKLVHDAPWDSYWGDGPNGHGTNMLGKLLTSIRANLT